MRTVVGYENGRPVWSENVPAYGGSVKIRGELVVAVSKPRRDPDQKDRRNAYARTKRYREKLRNAA